MAKNMERFEKNAVETLPQNALPPILSLCCELGMSPELSGWSRKEIFVRDFKNVLLFQIGSSWGSYMSVSVKVLWFRLSDLQLFSISFQERMPEWNCSSVTQLQKKKKDKTLCNVYMLLVSYNKATLTLFMLHQLDSW